MTTNPPPLVLASASPRRAELLSRVGYRFETCAAEVDESVRADEAPAGYVSRLARAKADAVWESGLVVVASDTCVVAPDGAVLGKPTDSRDAIRMLRSLSGRTHSVLTAVCVITGHGLKDPDTALTVHATKHDAPADVAAVERALGWA